MQGRGTQEGERVTGVVARIGAAVEASVGALADPALLQEPELAEVMGALERAVVRSRALLVAVAREGVARGLHGEAGFSVTDWIAVQCPALSAREVSEIAAVAQAGADPAHAPLIAAVESGEVSTTRAARALRALGRVRPGVGPEEYAQAAELVVAAARAERFTDKDMDRICTTLVTTCLSRREQEGRERSRHALRDLHESSLGDGSVRRFVLTVGDDADHEAVRAVLMSPLAAPASVQEREFTGEVDTRTAGQRRYDAFMTVFRRGVAGTEGQPTTPKAQVMVTVSLADLREQLDLREELDGSIGTSGTSAPGSGSGSGCGVSVHGGMVSLASVRRLACEADIIPTVLGTAGEIVELGRARRLVTPGQRRVLAHRDRGCTFPGCSVPATWCDAHHIVAWAQGGRSDISNYALLCPRHHTWVHRHQRRVVAAVHATGVRWKVR